MNTLYRGGAQNRLGAASGTSHLARDLSCYLEWYRLLDGKNQCPIQRTIVKAKKGTAAIGSGALQLDTHLAEVLWVAGRDEELWFEVQANPKNRRPPVRYDRALEVWAGGEVTFFGPIPRKSR